MSEALIESLTKKIEELRREVAEHAKEIRKLEAEIERKKKALALCNALLAYEQGRPIPATIFPAQKPAAPAAGGELPARAKVGNAVLEVLKEAGGSPLTIKQILEKLNEKGVEIKSKSPYRSVHMALKPLIWRGLVEKLSRSEYRAVV